MSNLALNIAVKAQNQTNAAMAQVAAAQNRVKLAVDQSKLAYDRYIQAMSSAKATQAQMKIAADQVAIALDRVKVAESNVTTATERAKSAQAAMVTATKEESNALSNLKGHMGESSLSLEDFTSKLALVTMGIQSAIGMVRGLIDGLISLGQAMIAPNAEMEQATIAWETLVGKGNAAQDMLSKLWQFAAKTPFQFQPINEAAQKLRAMGIAARDIIPLLTSVGDVLSALGRTTPAALEGVTMVFGKIQTQGRMMTRDMMMLSNWGINAWTILEKQMHLTHAQLQVMITKGLLPASVAIKDLKKGIEQLFPGAMLKQAYTFNGLITTLKDNLQLAWRSISGPAFNAAKVVLQSLGDLAASSKFQRLATVIGNEIGPSMRQLAGWLKTVIDKFSEWLSKKSTLDAFKATLSNIVVVVGSFAQGVRDTVPAIAKGIDMVNNLTSGLGFLGGSLNDSKDMAYQMGQMLAVLIGALYETLNVTGIVVNGMLFYWRFFFGDWAERMSAQIELYNVLAKALGLPTVQVPGSVLSTLEAGSVTGGAGGNRKFPASGGPDFGNGDTSGTGGTGTGRGRGGVKSQQFTASDIADLLKNAREMHLKFNKQLFEMLSTNDKIKYLWSLVGQHMDKLDKLMAGTHGGLLAYLQWIITGKKPPGLILDNGASGTPGTGTSGSQTGKYNAQFILVNNITINAGTADAKQLYDLLLRRLERDLRRSGQISNNLSGGKAA